MFAMHDLAGDEKYSLLAKEEVKMGDPPKWTRRSNLPEVTQSWHNYMKRQVVQDFQSSVLQVSDAPYDEDSLSTILHYPYEFPNGYNNEYGMERFRIPEALFDPAYNKSPNAHSMMSVSHVVTTSVGKSLTFQRVAAQSVLLKLNFFKRNVRY